MARHALSICCGFCRAQLDRSKVAEPCACGSLERVITFVVAGERCAMPLDFLLKRDHPSWERALRRLLSV